MSPAGTAPSGILWVLGSRTAPNDGLTWGVDAFATIQGALDAAAATLKVLDGATPAGGYTVGVAAGSYAEHTEVPSHVRLVGSGAEVATIDAGDTGSPITFDGAVDAAVSGFTLQGAGTTGAGVDVAGASNNITISRNIVTSNLSRAVRFQGRSSGLVDGNTLVDNNGPGVLANGEAVWAVVRNNIVAGNGNYGLRAINGARISQDYNLFYGNTPADLDGVAEGDHTVGGDPAFSATGHYYLTASSPAIDAADPLATVPAGGGVPADLGYKEFVACPLSLFLGPRINSTVTANSGVQKVEVGVVRVADATQPVTATLPTSWQTLNPGSTDQPLYFWQATTTPGTAGLYRVYSRATDAAGNTEANEKDWYEGAFVADATAPTVSWVGTPPSTSMGAAAHFRARAVGSVSTGTGTRFDVQEVYFSVTNPDSSVSTYPGEWDTTSGGTRAFSAWIPLPVTGSYSVWAVAVDEAGNKRQTAASALSVSRAVAASVTSHADASAVSDPAVTLRGTVRLGAASGEGTTFSAEGSFTDPAPDTWNATVDYGDGGGAESLTLNEKAFSLSHLYPLQGVYTVTVAVTDDDSATGQATCRVNVSNVAPVVSAPAGQSAREAQSHSFALGSFSDWSGDSPWTVAVDWGDGSSGSTFQASTQGTLAGRSHTYDDSGHYTVTVAVTDNGGGTGSAAFVASVANRAPSVSIRAQTRTTPSWLIVDLSTSVSDPSKADRDAGYHYSWRLTCNGSEVASGSSALFGFSISLDAPGTYVATVEVEDKDGGRATASWHTVVRPPLDARIRIVWPHGGAAVSEASLANVSAWLLERGTLTPADLRGWVPEVYLWRAVSNEPAQIVARGSHRAATGQEAALFDFNNSDVSAAQDPANRVHFFVTLEGTGWRTNVWAHAADGRTYHPDQDVPTGVASVGTAVDARIEVLWPHGGAPVSQATMANLTAALFRPGTLESVSSSWEPTVRLWRALNNGVAEEVGTGAKRIVTENGVTYPVWDFNNVDVGAARDPQNKLYFFLTIDGIETHSSVWVHGVDARTYFPQWDVR